MATVYRERVRAELEIGGLVIATPDVKSFHVSRTRGSISASFSATVEVDPLITLEPGSQIIIRAGTLTHLPLNQIFVGIIRSVTVNPSWENAHKIILNLSGNDGMFILDERKFTRHYPWSGLGRWASITGVNRKRSLETSQYRRVHNISGASSISWATNKHADSDDRVVKTPNIKDPFNWIKSPSDRREAAKVAGTQAIIELTPSVVISLPFVGATPDNDLWSISISNSSKAYITESRPCSSFWEISNTGVAKFGTINGQTCSNDRRTAYVRVVGVGYSRLTFTDDYGNWGSAEIISMVPHTHENLAQGGPAFGTFSA